MLSTWDTFAHKISATTQRLYIHFAQSEEGKRRWAEGGKIAGGNFGRAGGENRYPFLTLLWGEFGAKLLEQHRTALRRAWVFEEVLRLRVGQQ